MPLAVDVLFPLPVPPFRYLVPFDSPAGPLGGRVAAPWQGGVRIGLAVGLAELPGSQATEYREIVSWLDREPFVVTGGHELILELAASSGAPPGVVLASLLPVGLRDELHHEVQALGDMDTLGLPANEWLRADRLGAAELDLYRRQGMIRERVLPVERTTTRLVVQRPVDDALAGKAQANQREALELLERLESVASAAELARSADVPESAVRTLVRKGYAAYVELPAPPAPLPAPQPADTPLEGRGEAVPSAPVVLITGGLRRDRLAAMLPTLERDLDRGQSVLLLAPEGAYLEEAAALLASRLPILVLSGESSDEQRMRIWEEAAAGRPLVLLGTYTALLAPLRNLARIVVTEAGSGTYKLPSGPRLFVPAAARSLALRLGVPILLSDVLASPEMLVWSAGGATANTGRPVATTPITPGAAGSEKGAAGVKTGPIVELPNPRQRLFVSDLNGGSGWPLGSDLSLVLRQVQERGRQAVLLAPRRGFSAALSCNDCGHVLMCPNCDLALRYHKDQQRLRCHQCGYSSLPPEACPGCGAASLAPGRAAGSEWIANAVSRLLPELIVARLDSDRQDDLTPFREGRPGVLVGTTAVFRIPPLPHVSLIGITLLDTHLNVSDFRAAEESLRLLLQLPELAPGARPLVVIQTFQPEHEALAVLNTADTAAALADYGGRIMERRRRFDYPPFGQLAKIQVTSKERDAAEREAVRIAGSLRAAGAAEEEVLGPVPAPIARVRGQFSYLIYLRGEDERRFQEGLRSVAQTSGKVRVRLDVDPRDVAEFLE